MANVVNLSGIYFQPKRLEVLWTQGFSLVQQCMSLFHCLTCSIYSQYIIRYRNLSDSLLKLFSLAIHDLRPKLDHLIQSVSHLNTILIETDKKPQTLIRPQASDVNIILVQQLDSDLLLHCLDL